jgi:hypothetical protein
MTSFEEPDSVDFVGLGYMFVPCSINLNRLLLFLYDRENYSLSAQLSVYLPLYSHLLLINVKETVGIFKKKQLV